MCEQLPEGPEHPIASGLAALVGVTLAVGLILGLVVLAGTKVLGLDGESDSGSSSGGRSMYLPKPEKTPTETGPQITLAPEQESESAESTPSADPTATKSARKQISLSASTTQAAPMEQFNLTGVYPGGEGAILTVQRFQDGSWQEFPATGSVSGEAFQIPVQTSQPGPNRFRVLDSDSGLQSNEIRVTIG